MDGAARGNAHWFKDKASGATYVTLSVERSKKKAGSTSPFRTLFSKFHQRELEDFRTRSSSLLQIFNEYLGGSSSQDFRQIQFNYWLNHSPSYRSAHIF